MGTKDEGEQVRKSGEKGEISRRGIDGPLRPGTRTGKRVILVEDKHGKK